MELNLAEGCKAYGDSAYLDYEYQDKLAELEKIKLVAEPKSNSLRSINLEHFVNLKYIRKFIEGAFGVISRLMPRKIHATTQRFEIKIVGFLVAAAINFLIN